MNGLLTRSVVFLGLCGGVACADTAAPASEVTSSTSGIETGGGSSSDASTADLSTGRTESGSSESTPDDAIRERIDDAVAAGFEGAILVRAEHEVLVLEGHGTADRSANRANTPPTAFDFGSIMKDFTAAAVFALQADGLLTTSDTVGMILPDVPPDKSDITIAQLLQHRAGLGEYHDTLGDFEPMDRAQARAAIFGQSLLFEPGAEEAYSNAGFTLLADIVETVSGQPFATYVDEAVVEPAGLQSTGFFGDELWARRPHAIGYDASMFQGNDLASWPYTWALVGNGGLVTTVEDLDQWLDALWAGTVLDAEAFEAYRADYLSPVDFDGADVYAYAGGGDYGFAGVAIDIPSTGGRIVIGTNTANNFDIELLAQDLALVVLEG